MSGPESLESKQSEWVDLTGLGIRGVDTGGGGGFHASRNRPGGRHNALDFLSVVGQGVRTPTGGVIVRQAHSGTADLTGVVIRTDDGEEIKILYITPDKTLIGKRVEPGQVIGVAQDIHADDRGYPKHVPQHVHIQVENQKGVKVDPTARFRPASSKRP
jgi:hypothetical protein